MSQLAFEWPRADTYDPEDFIVSDSNADAVRFLEALPDGKSYAALLSGPCASGKTHLTCRWMKRAGAILLDASAVGRLASGQLWQQTAPAVLEDIEVIKDEAALFHL